MPKTTSQDVEIAYEVYGEGEPLLCIMGLGGTKELWEPQIEGLQDKFRLFVFDNRGVGASAVPKNPWTMADMARDAVAVLDAEGISSAHVLGVSMGGMIAKHVALNHSERVRRLILAATTAGAFIAPPGPEMLQLLTGAGAKTPQEVARNSLRAMFTQEFIDREAEFCEKMMALQLRYLPPRRGFMGQMNAVMAHNTQGRLPEIIHETLVITGDLDELVPPRNSEVLAAGIPQAKLKVIPGTAHGFFFDRAADVNREVAAFLNA